MTGRIPSAGYKAWICNAADCTSGRVDQSISALAAHGTVRESLPSYGSCYSVNK